MSLTTTAKTQLKQLKTGIHLVTITDASLAKDHTGQLILSNNGEKGICIKFTNGKNLSFENTYWIKGDKEWIFKKMCSAANIDASQPKFKAEAVGKRLYIFIREVHDVDGDEIVIDEVTMQPIVNYYIFQYSEYFDNGITPVVAGNPETNNGIASGDFIDYRQIDAIAKQLRKQRMPEQKSKAIMPNNNFHSEPKTPVEPYQEKEIDWSEEEVVETMGAMPMSDTKVNPSTTTDPWDL